MRRPALLAAALLLGILASACGGGAAPPASSPCATSGTPAAAASTPATSGTAAPSGPAAPVIYILGGSSARESIVGNACLAEQIERAGGPAVRVLDLGASNQSYSQDAALVGAMPGGPALVLIGVNQGRYTGPAAAPAAASSVARATLAAASEVKHKYTAAAILGDAEKAALAARWAAEREPLFDRYYAANEAELDRLVRLCRKRGFHPVLMELPINLETAGDTLSRVRARYRAGCRRLAARYDIPFLDFVAEAGLKNEEFYDLFHLVEPGRVKWQDRLTAAVVPLLREYRIGAD